MLLGTAAGSLAKDNKGKQVNIPGTHVFITPPPVYQLATSFTGLETPHYNILVNDEQLNYESMASSLTPYSYKANGLTVYDYTDTIVAGYHAKFFHMGGKEAKLYTLVFGDTSFCAQVNGIYPPGEIDTGGRIKKIILSVAYDKSLDVDPIATASFVLNESSSKYKFYTKSNGMYVYTPGDKDTTDISMFTVASMPADSSTVPVSINDMTIRQFEEKGLTGKEYKSMSTERVNSYKAYEAEIYGELQERRVLIYQLIVVHEDKALLLQGIAYNEFEQHVAEFKKLAHTVRFK